MDQNHLEVVNYVQELPPQEKVMIYNVYKEFIPKNNKWNKYVKSNIKKRHNELLDHLSNYWECSKTEVKEYMEFLGND